MSDQAEIKFYHRGTNVYYEFSNFYQGKPINFPLTSGYENLQGQWKTAEHLFQAAKYAHDKNVVENIRQAATPRLAFTLARQSWSKLTQDQKDSWDGNWQGDGNTSRKIAVMRMLVEHKFRQDDYLKNLLLQTGDKKIIEDTKSDTLNPEIKRDDCWGNATLYERDDKGQKTKSTGKEGKNWLGKVLMEVRTKLKNDETPNFPPLDPLASLKKDTITKINQKMAEDPEIKTSELQDSNKNWKKNIQISTQETDVSSIYNALIADINTKREGKMLEQTFQKLISQAQQAMQDGNIFTLGKLLIDIYDYRQHNRLYSQHKNEIEQWETCVNQQDNNNFKILKISAINHLLQQEPKVTITELREFNRHFQRIISQTNDFTKINNFESIVRDNVIEVRTEKRFDQILVNARNAKSEEEKSLVIQEIYKWRDTTNNWESDLWRRRKSEMEAFLNGKWSSDKNNTEDESHWLKQTFQIFAVGISLVLVIWLLAKLVKKGRRKF